MEGNTYGRIGRPDRLAGEASCWPRIGAATPPLLNVAGATVSSSVISSKSFSESLSDSSRSCWMSLSSIQATGWTLLTHPQFSHLLMGWGGSCHWLKLSLYSSLKEKFMLFIVTLILMLVVWSVGTRYRLTSNSLSLKAILILRGIVTSRMSLFKAASNTFTGLSNGATVGLQIERISAPNWLGTENENRSGKPGEQILSRLLSSN